MIYALIIAALGIIIIALAIVTAAIQAHNGKRREVLYGELEAAHIDKEALKTQLANAQARDRQHVSDMEQLRLSFNTLLKERNELAARNTTLQEAMEAKPTTQPKRVVRKNSTQQEGRNE